MASSLRKPDPLSFEGNVAENWRSFVLDYDIYVKAAHPAANAATRAYILLNLAGKEAIERSRTFVYAQGESAENPDHLKAKFAALCEPRKNITLMRHRFNTRNQRASESYQTYFVDLSNKAGSCDFGDLKDEFIRDRIVCGIYSDTVRKLLLREADLTLIRAKDICLTNELADIDSKDINTDPDFTINTVNTVKTKKPKNGYSNNRKPPSTSSAIPKKFYSNCKFCAGSHQAGACPAYGQQCPRCKKYNHFASCCGSSPGQYTPSRPPSRPTSSYVPQRRFNRNYRYMHEVEYEDPEYETYMDENMEDLVIESIDSTTQKGEIHVTAKVNNKNLELKVDSGAKCNVISMEQLKTVQLPVKIDSSKTVSLISYSNDTIKTLGTTSLNCKFSDRNAMLKFHVVDSKAKTILGLQDALNLKLLKLHPDVHEINTKPTHIPIDIWNEYPYVFEEKPGRLPVTYRIKLNPDIPSVIKPARRLPHGMVNQVKSQLNQMVTDGIIAKVTEPTEWVSQMVAAKKKNTDQLRICIDPRDLNKALMRPHHPLKTVDEVASTIPGATVFSILDAKSAFWHIPLDDKSSYYTTLATPFGRYRYLRMPYGLTSGSEVYQQAIEQLLEGTPCKVIVDDIFIPGTNLADHDSNLKCVLNRIREINLHLNPDKCKFRVTKVKYVGNVFTSHGLLPDPEKVSAITNFTTPKSMNDVQRFLGMINYVSRYVPSFTDIAAPLYELLRKDVVFHGNRITNLRLIH